MTAARFQLMLEQESNPTQKNLIASTPGFELMRSSKPGDPGVTSFQEKTPGKSSIFTVDLPSTLTKKQPLQNTCLFAGNQRYKNRLFCPKHMIKTFCVVSELSCTVLL